MTVIESTGWHLLGLIVLIVSLYLLVKNLNESHINKLINYINKTLPNTPLTPLKPKSSILEVTKQENKKNEPPSQFMLGMDVKQWTDKFIFYLKENKIEHNKNELLLSKLEPFCQSLIYEFKFSSDTDIAFEQHILLMNKLFQLKKKNNNINNKIPTADVSVKQVSQSLNNNNNNQNLRVLIPGLSLNLNVDYKL